MVNMRFLTAVTTLASIASAAYTVQDDYSPNNFASMFDFFTGNDPTDGFVNYIDQGKAQSSGLLKVQNNQVYMGVDATNIASGRGRDSIRLTSKKVYNHGLFILDLAHMPGGQCGSWPAFWLLGPDWPNKGEIDIIEGVNTQKGNSFAMHTNSGCSITNTGNFAGQLKYSNCDVKAANQPDNAGCSISSTNDQSYGTGFNAANGGVYATEWTSKAVTIWHFPRSAVPADIASGNPNPANWGLPSAQFTGACDLDKHVVNQQIVFDITFCGQWAGQVWNDDPTCKAKAATCQEFVKNKPTEFKDTFWSINSLKVYQDNGAAVPSGTRTTRTLSPTGGLPGSSTSNPVVVAPTQAGTQTLTLTQTLTRINSGMTTTAAGSATTTTTTPVVPTTTTSAVPGVSTTTTGVPIVTTTSAPLPIVPVPVPTTTTQMLNPPAPTTTAQGWAPRPTWGNHGDHKWGGWGGWGRPGRIVRKMAV